jgi:hypothetical protein
MDTITRDILVPLGQEIARNLPDGWTLGGIDMDLRGVQLVGPDNGHLYVSPLNYGKTDRLEISGSYPQNSVYDLPRFEITVSTSRGAATIAREIKRRILDAGYLVSLAKVHADNATMAANHATRRALAEELAAVLGARVEDEDARSTRSSLSYYGGADSASVDIRLSYAGDQAAEVKIRSLDADTLRAVVRVIAERNAAR